jgi:hypothetical protein
MITIGRIAEKYGMLPSMVAQQATTYDLMITDVLATFDNYQQKKSSGKLMDASVYDLSTEELMRLKDLGKNG